MSEILQHSRYMDFLKPNVLVLLVDHVHDVIAVGSEVSYVELYDGSDGKPTGSGYAVMLLILFIVCLRLRMKRVYCMCGFLIVSICWGNVLLLTTLEPHFTLGRNSLL